MSDLTTKEEAACRTALGYLKAQLGTWESLGRALHAKPLVLGRVARGRPVSASLAIRIARVAGVGVDDLLGGKYPPTCPYCGHAKDGAA
jgi:hypothetical protein